MTGGPLFDGSLQLTVRLVGPAAVTPGASGGPGASSSSVTVTVIGWSAVFSRAPAPLVARTSTSYSLSPPASVGASWFGADLNVSSPVAESSENLDWSAPPAIVYPVTLSSASPSVASTVPAPVWFSAALNVADEVNVGDALASVVPVPDADQSLSPSAFLASTCTSYVVFSARSSIVLLVPDTFVSPAVKAPLSPTRYCRS